MSPPFSCHLFPSSTVTFSLSQCMCFLLHGPVVTIPGRNQSFRCQLFSAVAITHLQNVSWLLNGSTLEDYGLDNVVTEFRPGPRGIGILRFINLSLENNDTSIQCQVTLQSGVTIQSASLLLQGMKVMGNDDGLTIKVRQLLGN